jgi:hypothetical protein
MPFLSFANPSGLWFLPLAGLPLMIHLLRRRRARVIPFPDIRYLKQARTATVLISRIRQLLLLALRTLLILCLALIPARPHTALRLPAWLGGASTRTVIILDDSASMAARADSVSLFEQARQKAQDHLKQLGPQSLTAVVSASRGSRIISGFKDPRRAGAAVKAAPQTALSTDLPAAINTAARLLESSGPGRGMILVVSDLQKTAFPAGGAMKPKGAEPNLRVIPVRASRRLENLIWEKVEAKPLIGKLLLEGRAGGLRHPRIELKSGKRTVYSASPDPDSGGKFRLAFGLPAVDSLLLLSGGDHLDADDHYYIAPVTKGQRRVMLACQTGTEEGRVALRAFQSLSRAGYQIDIYQSGKPTENAVYDVLAVCMPSIDGVFQNHIIQNARKYRAFLIMPPPSADPVSYNQKLLSLLDGISLNALSDSAAGYRLVKSSKAEASLPDLLQEGLDPVRVQRYWRISAGGDPVITVNGNDPALILSNHGGRKWALLLTGWIPPMCDLALRPAFPVLLLQTMEALSGNRPLQGYAGEKVSDPDLAVSPGLAEGKFPEQPGWYSTEVRPLAVNVDPAESDLTPAGEHELEKFFGRGIWPAPDRGAGIPGGPYPLERLLLLLSAALMAAEMLVRRA